MSGRVACRTCGGSGREAVSVGGPCRWCGGEGTTADTGARNPQWRQLVGLAVAGRAQTFDLGLRFESDALRHSRSMLAYLVRAQEEYGAGYLAGTFERFGSPAVCTRGGK